MTPTVTNPKTGLSVASIRGPEDLKDKSDDELNAFADEVRRFLIESVAETGGHIGANLGTVELSIALHSVFQTPADTIVWDTGHQGYTHKIITGRAQSFATLNTYGGMNRFVSRSESEHDPIEASHAGTAVSVGLGLALARARAGDEHWTIAVVGDGALAEGMTLEALNHAAVEKTKLMVVINDNGYAISPGFGALHEALQSPARASGLFTALGFEYTGPLDGHDISSMRAAILRARDAEKVPVLHVRTVKGFGWKPADAHPFRQHFSFPFDPESGAPRAAAPPPSYPDVVAEVVRSEMQTDTDIVCITPSTLYATGLARVFEEFPERCFDPGMEEQHALGMTVGLALGGKKPVIAYQSTFLQRAFDQLLHDVCFANLPTLILSYRSGFSGYDNPTHHGIFDFAYMRALPNLTVLYPKDRHEAEAMVRTSLRELTGPTVILMPYGPVDDFDPSVSQETGKTLRAPQVVREGTNLALLTVGNKFAVANEVVARLRLEDIDTGLVNLRCLKPLPSEGLTDILTSYARIVTLEESILDGGVGSAIASLITDNGLDTELLRIGLPCTFVEPGSNEELTAAYGLDANGVLRQIYRRWSDFAAGEEE